MARLDAFVLRTFSRGFIVLHGYVLPFVLILTCILASGALILAVSGASSGAFGGGFAHPDGPRGPPVSLF